MKFEGPPRALPKPAAETTPAITEQPEGEFTPEHGQMLYDQLFEAKAKGDILRDVLSKFGKEILNKPAAELRAEWTQYAENCSVAILEHQNEIAKIKEGMPQGPQDLGYDEITYFNQRREIAHLENDIRNTEVLKKQYEALLEIVQEGDQKEDAYLKLQAADKEAKEEVGRRFEKAHEYQVTASEKGIHFGVKYPERGIMVLVKEFEGIDSEEWEKSSLEALNSERTVLSDQLLMIRSLNREGATLVDPTREKEIERERDRIGAKNSIYSYNGKRFEGPYGTATSYEDRLERLERVIESRGEKEEKAA